MRKRRESHSRSRSGSVDSLGRRKKSNRKDYRERDRDSRKGRYLATRRRSRSRSHSYENNRKGSYTISNYNKRTNSRSNDREGRRRRRRKGRNSLSRSRSRSHSQTKEYERHEIYPIPREEINERAADDLRLRILKTQEIEGNQPPDPEKHPDKETSAEEEMKKLLGFSGFDSTKGKKVIEATDVANGGMRKDAKREYRQYMNRRGGFNRPLTR